MSNKNLEMMKKIIEDKKKASANQNSKGRPQKSIGGAQKARISTKNGGVFDK
ncbi:hypothetical protein [Clostridium ihumii]|uniref:hypothetical protein n=1 Tax=Clostridium ihumii TaxID=1470356 RepID=UPI000A9610B8|nr:hypothetical protein [Clostridium ihumii]